MAGPEKERQTRAISPKNLFAKARALIKRRPSPDSHQPPKEGWRERLNNEMKGVSTPV